VLPNLIDCPNLDSIIESPSKTLNVLILEFSKNSYPNGSEGGASLSLLDPCKVGKV
jgi:hypothetical protein